MVVTVTPADFMWAYTAMNNSGLVMLSNAKECYDKGSKRDAVIFGGVAIFVYAVTAVNLISRLL